MIENVINTIESVTKPITEESAVWSTLTLVLTAVGSVLLLLLLCNVCAFTRLYCVNDCCYWCCIFSGMPLKKKITQTMQNGMGEHWVSPSWSPRGQCLVKFCMKRGIRPNCGTATEILFGEKRLTMHWVLRV